MKVHLFVLVFVVSMLTSCAAFQQKGGSIDMLDTSAITYTNPMDIKYIGDPYVFRHEGMYYCIPTSAANGYKLWKSPDLINWELDGMSYKRKGDSWSISDYWAPEVIYHNEQFHMFYTARSMSQKRLLIGHAVSDQPGGPYIDVVNEPFFDPGYAVIDASVFIDDDGAAYMYYARDCSENIVNGSHVSQVYVVGLNDDLSAAVGEPTLLLTPDQPWEKINGNAWQWNEGPIILKRFGKYYLFYSANCFDKAAYGVGYAVSDSPTGPFEKHSTPILWYTQDKKDADGFPYISGPGHNSFAYSPDDRELFIVYHTHMNTQKPSGDRQTAIDRILFNEDGTVRVIGPGIAPTLTPSGVNGMTLILPDEYTHVKEGTAPESFTFKEKTSLTAIAVYPPADGFTEDAALTIIADGKPIASDIKPYEPDALPGYSKILYFEPISVKRLEISLSGTKYTDVLMMKSN